jgi:hypothetical protein
MERLGITGHSGSALAGTKLVTADLTFLVKVNLVRNKVVDVPSDLAAHLALSVAVDKALLKIDSGVLHTA